MSNWNHPKKCIVCGAVYMPTTGNQKVCGYECRKAMKRVAWVEWAKVNSPDYKVLSHIPRGEMSPEEAVSKVRAEREAKKKKVAKAKAPPKKRGPQEGFDRPPAPKKMWDVSGCPFTDPDSTLVFMAGSKKIPFGPVIDPFCGLGYQ